MPQAQNTSLPADLTSKLSRLEQRVRSLALLRGLGRLAVVVAIGLAGGMLVDLLWDVGRAVRVGLLGVMAGSAAFVAWRRVIRPGIRKLGPADLAALIEETHPELGERLTSTVEFADPDVPDDQKGSPLMREMLTRQTVRSVEAIDFTDSLPAARSFRWWLAGTGALLLLLTPFTVVPSAYGLLWTRFFVPWGNFDRVSALMFEVENGNRVVGRGSDVAINVEPRWRFGPGERPETVRLKRIDATGRTDSRRMQFDQGAGAWTTTIPHVLAPFEYSIAAEDSRSKRYRIDVVDPPEILRASLEIQPPPYTGRPADVNDGVVGEIPVFAGSRLAFELEFNKPVRQAELEWLDIAGALPATGPDASPRFVLAANRRSGTLEMTARIEAGESKVDNRGTPSSTLRAPFAFRLTDEYGLHNSEEPNRILVVTPDRPPRLELSGSDEPQRVRSDDVFAVTAMATDDVGVGALELHYEVTGSGKKMVPVGNANLGGEAVSQEFELPIAELGLSSGDVLTYRVRTADERPVPGPQEVWSKPRVLTVNPEAEPLGIAELVEEQDLLQERLEAVRSDLDKNRDQVADLQRQADEDAAEDRAFEPNTEVPSLSEEQRKLARRLEELARRFAQHPLLAGLTPQARQVARQDLAKARDHLRKSLQKPASETADLLDQSSARLGTAERKLKELAKQFDELAEIERDLLELQRLARQAERLAEDARELHRPMSGGPAGRTPNNAPPRNNNDRQRLETERRELADQVDDLLKRRPELIEAARKAHFERLAGISRDLRDLAGSEGRLADALRDESESAAEETAVLSREQERLLEQARRLAAGNDEHDSSSALSTGTETLQKALDELKAGNLQAALDRQQQVVEQLDQRAQQLRKNPDSHSNIRERTERLEQLARRQESLREQLAALSRNRRPAEPPPSPIQPDVASQPATASTDERAQAAQRRPSPANQSERQGNDSPVQRRNESRPDARQAQAQQEQLTQDAAQMAWEVAQRHGPESPSAQQAAEMARLCGG